MTTILVNGVKREVQAPADTPLLYVLKKRPGAFQSAVWLWARAMRSLFGAAQRQGGAVLHHAAWRRWATKRSQRWRVCRRGGPNNGA